VTPVTNIDIHRERPKISSISSNSLSNSSTTLITESQAQSQIEINLLDHSTTEHTSINNRTTEPTSSTNNSHSGSDMTLDTNE
jgi:hypothetical protein